MGLIERAINDLKTIAGNKTTGWASDVVLTAPTLETAEFRGVHMKHRISLSTEGEDINSRTARLFISENSLLEEFPGYPTRNADGEIYLKDHLVQVKDSTEIEKNYIIREWFPDESLGVIVCILESYE